MKNGILETTLLVDNVFTRIIRMAGLVFLFLLIALQAIPRDSQVKGQSISTSHSARPVSARLPVAPDPALRARITDSYSKLPLSFEANRGQTDSSIRFISRGQGYSMLLTAMEAHLILQKEMAGNDLTSDVRPLPARKIASGNLAVMRMQFIGANPRSQLIGGEALSGKVNYLLGDKQENPLTNIPTYASVKQARLYPGIDLIYYGNRQQLEYDFVVAPGANPRKIKIGFKGADKLEIASNGDLVLHLGGEQIRQRKPQIYQEANGVRQKIAGGYIFTGKLDIGFRIGRFDHTRPLIIDPVLSYSTYLGGSGSDRGYGIAVDQTGSAYVVGSGGMGFRTTAGAYQTSGNGTFVTKLNAAGSALVYSTFLGSSSFGIAVDSVGNAYVTGGGSDAMVTKLNATGSAILYSTTIGGSDNDAGVSIAVDTSGSAYLTGVTNSANFPTVNAAQNTAGGTTLFKSTNGAGSWGTSTLGLNASRVLSLAIHPTVPSIIYAGTSDGGVFKSVNAGASWSAVNNGLTAPRIQALAIDPLNPSTIYAGLGYPSTDGIFKSTDGGGSWSVTGLAFGSVNTIVIDPTTPATLYTGTLSGVYKSTDGGAVGNRSMRG